MSEITTDTFDYSHLPYDVCVWIRDLQKSDANFPDDLNLRSMSESERNALVEYLRTDDGTLSEGDQEFTERAADLLEQLRSEEEQNGYEEAK